MESLGRNQFCQDFSEYATQQRRVMGKRRKKVGKNLFTVIFYKRKLWTKSPSVEQTHVKLFTILLYGSCKNRCYAAVNNMNW